MIPILILAAICGLIAGTLILGKAYARQPGGLIACNTAGLTDGGIVSRYATTAFTTPNLVAGKGATAGKDIVPCAATGVVPLGFVPDTAGVGEWAATQMGYGSIVLGVASAAIAADADVYTAAGGQLSATGGTGKYLMGRSVTAATSAGDEFSLIPCKPVLQP